LSLNDRRINRNARAGNANYTGGHATEQKKKGPAEAGPFRRNPNYKSKLPILATLLAATTLLATLARLRVLLTRLLVSAALATLLATLVLLLVHRVPPWLLPLRE
jgi:hypothetical protein